MVYPIVLGRGKRLFPEGSESSALRLIESRTAGEAVILIYVPK
jgi:dihydrofolate reductase